MPPHGPSKRPKVLGYLERTNLRISLQMMDDQIQKLDTQQSLKVGQLFADVYRIVGWIGQGANGTVLEAEHTLLSRHVALKIFPAEILADADATRRFNNEAKAIAKLDHQNIVKATAAGISSDGIPFIATELVEGKTLESILEQNAGFIKREPLLNIFNQIFDALSYAHEQGIVHRDLKPSNVMITESGEVKILDFGIAKFLSANPQDKTATRLLMGSPAYMSPEQAGNKPVDHRSDIYSLGVLLFRCVSGKLPFEADSDLMMMYQHQNSAAPKLSLPKESDINADLMNALVQRCLAKDPNDRYAKVSELQVDLNRMANIEVPSKNFEQQGISKKTITNLLCSTLLIAGLLCYFGFSPKTKKVENQPARIEQKQALSSEQKDERESSHRTSEGKISLNSSNAEFLIWRARNFYHSSEHKEHPAERLALCQKSVQTYDKALAVLFKKPDNYLHYLANVGKCRALGHRLLADQRLGSVTEERAEEINTQRMRLLSAAYGLVPRNSYEAGVISRELGIILIALNKPDVAREELNKAINLREAQAEWSPDSERYADRDDFKEADKPVDLLIAYCALIKIEKERGDKKRVLDLYKRFWQASKTIVNSSEEAFMKELVQYPLLLGSAGKKAEAFEVLQNLVDQSCSEKHLGDKTADFLTIAQAYATLGNKSKALELVQTAEDDIAKVSPLNARLTDVLARAKQVRVEINSRT